MTRHWQDPIGMGNIIGSTFRHTKFIQSCYAIQILCKVSRAGSQLTDSISDRDSVFVICSNFTSIYTRAADTRTEK